MGLVVATLYQYTLLMVDFLNSFMEREIHAQKKKKVVGSANNNKNTRPITLPLSGRSYTSTGVKGQTVLGKTATLLIKSPSANYQ